MKSATYLMAIFAAFALDAHAADSYDSYDAFYTEQEGAVFKNPLQDAGSLYSNSGRTRVYAELRSTVDGKRAKIQVSSNQITINQRRYRFAQAAAFPNEPTIDIYPGSANVFAAGRQGSRPPLLCLEGNGSGSGEASRHQQVYLLIDPFGRKPAFLHLPSLLSSCRAVLTTPDGEIAFPANSYLWNEAHDTKTGLLISYATFEQGHYVMTGQSIRLQFLSPENPFKFSVQR